MKQNIGKVLFILICGVIFVCAASYVSSRVFMQLHHLPTESAGIFTIWQYWLAYYQYPDKYIKISVNLCAFGPYLLLAAAITAAVVHRKPQSLHGDARFAKLSEIKKAGLIDPPKGYDKTILVGKYKNNYLTYGGYQFVMLAAPTRSGKGVGVVIPNCLNYSDSLVVLDIKLENFDITSGFRAEHGQEVYLFAPFDVNGRTHRYNPLEYISADPAERIGDIDAIGTALYSGGNENDKFWSENAKDLFRGLCLLVLENLELPKTLGEILRQASGKGKPFKQHVQEMLAAGIDNKGQSYSSACIDALNRIINNSDNTLAGIVSTFNAPLLIFQNPRVDCATSANDFDLRQVRRKKMTIYLGITPDKLKDAAVLVNLFFDQLLNLNTRVLPSQDKTLKYQCLLILDEFTAIGKVAMIQQSISYQAGYDMRVLTIIQNKSQLEDKYGKSGALTLMANHALMIMYAPSPVVQSDANEYSEMLGYQTVKAKNKSRSFGQQGSRSESESEQRRALLLPQEIKELGAWREIVSLENCKPILCDKIKYFEDPAFTKRANHPVPPIPLQDIDLFVAKLEDRKRDIEESDFDDPNFVNHIEDIDKVPDLPDNLSSYDEDEINELINHAAAAISEHVVKPALDTGQYKVNTDDAATLAQNMFGSDEDEDSEDSAFDFVASPLTQTDNAASEKDEVLNMLNAFASAEQKEHELHQQAESVAETESQAVPAETSLDTKPVLIDIDDTDKAAVGPLNAFGLSSADETDDEDAVNDDSLGMQKDLSAFGLEPTHDVDLTEFNSQQATRS